MLNINKHRHILFSLIKDIYSTPLGGILGFKGGTMAYFFYGLDRFSVDLDFDLLDPDRYDLLSANIPPILTKYGIIKDDSAKRFTYFYLLSYEAYQRTVKIEISKRNDKNSSYLLSNFYGTDVKIQRIEDAFANKLLACTTRNKTAYRDFYDVLFYIKKGVMANENIILKTINKNVKEYMTALIKFTEDNVTNQLILHGIGELINENQKQYIRQNFKKELISQLHFYIDQ